MSDLKDAHPGAVLGVLLVAFGSVFLTSWLVMLGLGVAHSQWPTIPAFGYWAVFALLAALRVLVGIARRLVRK